MEVNDHKLLFRVLDGQVAHQQAALEVCGADRPAERAGQRNAIGVVYLKKRGREQAAVDLADRRQGEGNIGTRVVHRIRRIVYPEILPLADAVGTARVIVDLLKHEDRRGVVLIIQSLVNADKVCGNAVVIIGHDILTAVHEEVGILAETAVADVPADK